jgi:putative phage-type endonuclease
MKRISTAKLSEEQWQQTRLGLVRAGKVGGSDASTLLGLNPYKSAISLYYQALGLVSVPNKMNAIMLHGKQLESYVADCWQYWDGTEDGWVNNTLANNKIKEYKKVKAILMNPKYPALFANIDGKITKHPDYQTHGILEVKTISGYSADMWEGGIPPSYLIQLQHYLIVTGWKWGEIVYMKDGRELGCVTFDADKELQERILNAANDFYENVNHVRGLLREDAPQDELMDIAMQYEPPADDTKAFSDFISEKHKARENDVRVVADDDTESSIAGYTEVTAKIKSLETHKQLAQNQIKQFMEREGANILTFNGGKITWRTKFNITYDKVN